MKISLIQKGIKWLSPEENRASWEEWIAKCICHDLVVLPEMFTTGFCSETHRCAESGEETLEWMKQMSRKYYCTLMGSVSVSVEEGCFNRLYVVRPDGTHHVYDKRHLFSYGGEQRFYKAGEERLIIDIKGVKILPIICYDLRFPVWTRNRQIPGEGTEIADYDVLVCVANWPHPRRSRWDILLRARAIENVSYVCGVNIVGDDPHGRYSGGTAVIDFRGDDLLTIPDDEEGIISFDVDQVALGRFRSTFHALFDADDFEIKEVKEVRV